MLRELAVAIETIVLAKEERLATENLEGEDRSGGGECVKVVEGGEGEGRPNREEGFTRRRRRTRTRGAKIDLGAAEERDELMQRVLDIVQCVLKVGSMLRRYTPS